MILTAIIINKNEEDFIGDCLESLKWVDEIIVLDGGSTDNSLKIAKKYGARIEKQTEKSFAGWRTEAIILAKGKWLLYIDADERVTPLLKQEIQEFIEHPTKYTTMAIPRRNFLLAKELRYGGWSPDYVERLFIKDKLEKWEGQLHERPVYQGELGYLTNSLIHLQPEKIEPALEKSIKWSEVEAQMLYEANHPIIVWWRVIRMGLTTLFERLIKKQGYRDGIEGWIESIYQSFHTMIVYLRLWEKQLQNKNTKP